MAHGKRGGLAPLRSRTLLTQVLAVNTLLVALTALVAVVVAQDHVDGAPSLEDLRLLGLAVASVVLLNSFLLRHRLAPVERLVRAMAEVDLASPCRGTPIPARAAREVRTLTAGFNRMLDRLQEERRQAGRATLRAQEQERSRIAQDLHDEVNQALTAILLRLQATMESAPAGLRPELGETKRLVNQAMEELLHLARELRPTALDDHGLVPALASQVAAFEERTRVRAAFRAHGPAPPLSAEEELVLYRVCQESLSNVARHAAARRVDVELCFVGGTLLRVRDDGRGFDAGPAGARPRGRPGGLGLSGMRERALLVDGRLSVASHPGTGTTIELTMGGR